MKFKTLNMSANSQKDVGAFYGVNRTNKINDFQVSECMNFDCENFPYFSTRRSRELFYNDEKMAIICHDTDVTDDYKVTGVTDGGGFVYREKVTDFEDGLSGTKAVYEHLGQYLLLPSCRVVSVNHEEEAVISKDFYTLSEWVDRGALAGYGKDVDFYSDYFETNYTSAYNNSAGLKNHYWVAYLINQKLLYPGVCIRVGFKNQYLNASLTDWISNDIKLPEGVFLKINEIMIYDSESAEDNKFVPYSEYFSSHSDVVYSENDYFQIFYTAYNSDGSFFDMKEWLKTVTTQNPIGSAGGFCEILGDGEGVGCGGYASNQCTSLMIDIVNVYSDVAASCFGRLFLCDLWGVDIFYSSGIAGEGFDFEISTSSGGAGFISSSEHGLWTALISYNGALYAFKRNAMYRITSSDGLSFYMDKVADIGAVSRDAVCVVSDVLYFLSETGLYKFTGSYPQELPDSLGKTYTDGVLGGYDNKLYASLTHSGGCELVVYDADISAYGVHDDFDAKKFVTYGGVLYGLSSDGCVYRMAGEREAIEFSLSTRKFFLSFEKKAINGIRLYFDFSGGENEKMEVFVSYDGGDYEPCFKPITSGKLKYVPIKFKKCDELCVKISGYGVFTLKGMSLSLYNGGDIKQNK